MEPLHILNRLLLILAITVSAFLLESTAAVAATALFTLFFIAAGAIFERVIGAPLPAPGLACRLAFLFLLGSGVFIVFYILLQMAGLAPLSIFLAYALLLLALLLYAWRTGRVSFHWSSRISSRLPFHLSPPLSFRLPLDAAFLNTVSSTVLLLAYLAFAFLIAGNILFSPQGIYVKDPLHPTYEASIAQSTAHLWPAEDLSYWGKPLQYNFGATILVQLAHAVFGMDILLVVYRFFPLLFAALFLPLAFALCQRFTQRPVLALLGTLFLVFATPLLLPLESLAGSAPINLLMLSRMASFGFAFALLALLYLFFTLRQKPGFTPYEHLFVLVLAITKSALALPILFAILASGAALCIQKRRLEPMLSAALLVLPAFLYILLFVSGAHLQSLWVLFPGFFRPGMHEPSGWMYYFFPFIAVVFSMIALFGVGLPVVLGRILSFLRAVWGALCSLSFPHRRRVIEPPAFRLDAIFFFSLFMAVFIVDMVELNNFQFAVSGAVLAVPFLLRAIDRSGFWSRPDIRLFAFVFLLSAAAYIIFFSPAGVLPLPPDAGNPVSMAYLHFNAAIAPLKQLAKSHFSSPVSCNSSSPLPQWYFYPAGLVDGMRFLEHEPVVSSPAGATARLVLFGRHYEFTPIQGCDPPWGPTDFVRTGVSGKQALIENQGSKGILMQPGYDERALGTLRFYRVVVEPSTLSPSWERFWSQVPSDDYLPAYNGYLALYNPYHFFVRKNEFNALLRGSRNATEQLPPEDGRLAEARAFLERYPIRYVVFERGERPSVWLMNALGGQLVFEKGDVAIYRMTTDDFT